MDSKTLIIFGLIGYLVLSKGGLSGCQMPKQTGYSDMESFDKKMSDLHKQAIYNKTTQKYAAEASFQQIMTDLGMQLFQEQMNKPGGQQK